MNNQGRSSASTETAFESRHRSQPEQLMNITMSERETLGRERAVAVSEDIKSRLACHRTTASTAFSLAVTRLREAQEGLDGTHQEKARKTSAYRLLSSPKHVQPTILDSLLLLFSAFPNSGSADHVLSALTGVDWTGCDRDRCSGVYRALAEHVDVYQLSADAARSVVQTQLLLAVRSGSLQLLACFLTSPTARRISFPGGIALSRISPCTKAPKEYLETTDIAVRVGPALFSSSRHQRLNCFPLDSSVALVAKSRLMLLDSAAATPSLYSLKGQAPFPSLRREEHPIYMNDQLTVTLHCTSKNIYQPQFALRVYRQRQETADAVVKVTVNSRASSVSFPVCRFSYNGQYLSCLFFSPSRTTKNVLYTLHTPLDLDGLAAESDLSFDDVEVPLQRISAIAALGVTSPYLSLSFTKGYTLAAGEVTILDHFQPFCVEMWVFLRHVDEPQTLVAIGDKSSDEVIIEVEPAFNSIVWKGGSRSTFLGASFARFVTPDMHSAVNAWTHVALNFTGTTWELCLNHRIVASDKALVRPNPIADAKCRLGASLSGFLAEVRVWNCHRSALELRRDAYRGLRGDEAFLGGYFPLNEGGGDVVADYSHKRAHALLAVGGGRSMNCWSAVPPPPVSSFAAACGDGDHSSETRCIVDVLPLAVAETSDDVLFTTTLSSYIVACHKNDTVHIYQYDIASALLTLEYAISVPKSWTLLDVRADAVHNTLLCCGADVGPRTSLVFWELQCQGPTMPGTLRHAAGVRTAMREKEATTAWSAGAAIFHCLAYYAERLVPLETSPRYPTWPAMMVTAEASTPWPQLLVDWGPDVIPVLFRLALIAATTTGGEEEVAPNMGCDVCSVLSVNMLLYHESTSDTRGTAERGLLGAPFTSVQEMMQVMNSAESWSAVLPTVDDAAHGALTTTRLDSLRDDLVRLALQPFARGTSLLDTCCRCFLTAEGTLAFVKKLAGKPRNSREETVFACLIDSFTTLPTAQDLLKRGNDGQVVFDALVLDTLAAAQTTEITELRESFAKGIRCLSVLMEVLLARCAAAASDGSADTPTASTTTGTVLQPPPPKSKSTAPPIVVLGEHCCKSLLKASRHIFEWATQRIHQHPDVASSVVRQLRRSHVGTLLPWLLLTLPSMPTQIANATLSLVRGCREALRLLTEALRHRETRKARWLSELRLILLHCEGLATSVLTVDGLRVLAATDSPSPSTVLLPSATTEEATSEPELPLNQQQLMPLLMGGLRKAGTPRDLLIKNLEHGVGPISKVVEELQRSDMSALRIMRDEGTRKMELQIMAAFCALCISTDQLTSATRATLQPAYRHVVALRPWILAKRQQSKGFIQEVASRAHFLAMFEQCCSDASDAAVSANGTTSVVSPTARQKGRRGTATGALTTTTTQRTSGAGAGIDSTRRRWRKLFQTWRNARLMATMQTTRPEGDSARRFGDIKDVLRSNATPEQLEQIVSMRVRLAHQRLRGLVALREIVEEARADRALSAALLPLIAQHLCQWHYARDVECCSTEDHFRLQEAFFQLFNAVVDGFNDTTASDTPPGLAPTRSSRNAPWDALFVSLLTCEFRAGDLRRVRGAAFTKALNTLCGAVAADVRTPPANATPEISVAAFSRPATISLGASGAPLLVSSQDALGTAVGTWSCLPPAATTEMPNSPAPSSRPSITCSRTYFEVHLVDVGSTGGVCAIGLGPADYSVSSFPGVDAGSCGLRLSDGVLFTGNKATGKPTGCTFAIGDVAGCGVDTEEHTVFWTRNGTVVATFPMDGEDARMLSCHPLIGLEGSVTVMVNLGDDPFEADDSVANAKRPASTASGKSKSGEDAPSPLISQNHRWQAFCAFSLRCALALAQCTANEASRTGTGNPTSSFSPPPSPTAAASPSGTSVDYLVQTMGLCFSQIVQMLESQQVLLFAAATLESGADDTSARRMRPEHTARNVLAVLQHTHTLTLLLAQVDASRAEALAEHVRPLSSTLHQLVAALLSFSAPLPVGCGEEGTSGSRPPSCSASFRLPPSAPSSHHGRLVNAAMLTYYFVAHLTPPAAVSAGRTLSATNAPSRDSATPPEPKRGSTVVAGDDGMLTMMIQLAGRVCVASREPGTLGAPPSPQRRSGSHADTRQSPRTAATAGVPAGSTRAISDGEGRETVSAPARRTTLANSATETAEQAVWMAVALLQRMIASASNQQSTHSWQPVLRDWLITCLDGQRTPGRDILLALTVLQSGPRLAVPGDVVPVHRSPQHATRGVLLWVSMQDGVCQILDEEGRQCYLPLRLVDVLWLDEARSEFPQQDCAVHGTLVQRVISLCERLWPATATATAPPPAHTMTMSVEQQAIQAAALSLLSRCVTRQVADVPLSLVRVALAAACAQAGTADTNTPVRRDVGQLRFQKVLTESWCAALLQTNKMRRRSVSASGALVLQYSASPVPPAPTQGTAPLVTSSTTQIYRTVDTTASMRSSALGVGGHSGSALPIWGSGIHTHRHHSRRSPLGETAQPFGSRPFSDSDVDDEDGDDDGEDEEDALGTDDDGAASDESADMDMLEGGGGSGDDDDDERYYVRRSGEFDGYVGGDRGGALSRFDRLRQEPQLAMREQDSRLPHALLRDRLSASSHSMSGDDNEADEFFFLDEFESLSPELAARQLDLLRGSRFLPNRREAEAELLLEQWIGGDAEAGMSVPPHSVTTISGIDGERQLSAEPAPSRVSTGIHFERSCLRLFSNRDIGQYYTIDLHIQLRHLRGHQILFVQQTSLTRVPSIEIIARIHRGSLEFGWIESLPGQEATATVLDVCRYALRPEDVGRWVRLTFAQVGTVVSIFCDGVLRNSHRMRPHVSSLLQEEFFLGGVPEDASSSLEGSIRDFCIYDVALRPAVIDQLAHSPSPLATFVESHLAVRLQVHDTVFVNAAPAPAAVLLDIAADGEVGNLEQRRDSADEGVAAGHQNGLDGKATNPSPVEEVDFGNDDECVDLYRLGDTSPLTYTHVWRQRETKSLDYLTANYSVCLRELTIHYSTRLVVALLLHSLAPPSGHSTDAGDRVLTVLAEMSNAKGVVQSLARNTLQSTDTELHELWRAAVGHVFNRVCEGSSRSIATSVAAASTDSPSEATGRHSAHVRDVAVAILESLLSIASVPEKRAPFESNHPIRSVISTHLEVLPGDVEKEIEAFHVYFDPRCANSQGTYTFAANAAMTELLYATRSFALTDFSVSLPRLFLDIRADVNTALQWGFKLAVVWQSESQLEAMRLVRRYMCQPALRSALPSLSLECFRLLEACAVVNSGRSRRLALACLTELLVLAPPSPFPQDLFSSLHALHLMAERLCRTGQSSSRSLHRTRFSQIALECYLFYRDTQLCLRDSNESLPAGFANASAHQTTTRAEVAAQEWKALSPQEEQAVYDKQRHQRRLVYELRKEERVELVALDVARSVSLEWTAQHVCLARSDSGVNSLITNIAFSTGRWYYEVKMAGTGSVFLGVYAIPPHTAREPGSATSAKRYALNGSSGVLQRPRDGASSEETVVVTRPLWTSKDTVGVVVDVSQRLCHFFVNGADTDVSFSFDAHADAAVTAAAPDAIAPSEGRDDEDGPSYRLFFALDHGEQIHVNFGGAPFDFEVPRRCLPVDPAHLGEESVMPYHQMRGFQDVALHFLQPTGPYPMPPFFYDVSEPFADCPERQGPSHVSLHAPEAVLTHGLDAKNTGPAFHTVHADCTVSGGRWYYEVSLRTQGLMQIGWAIQQAETPPLPTGEDGCGVGDTRVSWAVDGFRLLKWHDGKSETLTTARRWSIGDVVGCALDLVRGTMLFTLNGRPLVGHAVPADPTAASPSSSLTPSAFTYQNLPLGVPYVPCLSLRAGNAVLFNFGSTAFRYKPDGFSALGVPDTWVERIETFYANERLASIQRRLDALRGFFQHTSSTASPESPDPTVNLEPYRQLVQFVDQLCSATGKNYRQITEKVLSDAMDAESAAALTCTRDEAWCMTEKLLALIRILKSVFSFFAFGSGAASITARLFVALRPVLFRTWRFGMVDALLRESNVRAAYVRLSVNRVMARSGAALRGGRQGFQRTVFGQTFLSVATQHPRLFRTNKRLWRTVFIGEGAEDVGGPYREHITDMCTELMSSRLPFFVASPNQQQNLGTHRDAFVPAAGAVSPLDLNVFVFIGRLMGAAIRSGEPLSFTLPPLLWKLLCCQVASEADLQTVDLTCWQCIKEFRSLAAQDSGEQDVIDDVLDSTFFVTQLCDGTTRELIPNGAAVPVTAARLGTYVEALVHTRLHEFDQQVAKMREGVLSVVPEAVLVLLTPAELELKVCGVPDVTVDELRKSALYEGLTSDDRRVAFLWQALEEATPKQRRLFLRFASGRDRLPVKLRIVALVTTGDPDHSLVKAATCFFAVEIPDYSSLDVMKRKLYYSIENCIDMDTDFVARPTDEEERPQLFTTSDAEPLDEFGGSISEASVSTL